VTRATLRWTSDAVAVPAVLIRPERPGDVTAIVAVHDAAFADQPGEVVELVRRIRASAWYEPALSLVALLDDHVVGHVMLATVGLLGPDGVTRRVLNLTPLGVVPDRQRQGIGTALVEAALVVARARREPLVMVEGQPTYYPRLGFAPSRPVGIWFPGYVPVAAGMVALLPDDDPSVRGSVVYPEAFGHLAEH